MDKIKTIFVDLAYWQKIAEIAGLYIVLPLLLAFKIIDIPLWLILIIMGISSFIILKRDPTFDKKEHLNWKTGKLYFFRMFWFFILSAIVMVATIWIIDSSKLFILPREEPQMLLELAFIYPLFSVIPQELVYRTFFFHRYRSLFSSKPALILASAFFFSIGHIIYLSPLALFLTFIAGLIFSYRYNQTKSLILTVIEHALYGIWLFFSGLGTSCMVG